MLVTIISASLRNNNNSIRIAKQYARILDHHKIAYQILDLTTLPDDVLKALMTSDFSESPKFETLFNTYLKPSTHFIWTLPEYNGSFPGSAKVLIDAADVRAGFYDTHHLLAGVATGRAGNLRGMDHFTGVLHHVHGKVHWDKLPISQVHTLFSEDEAFDEATYSRMEEQVTDFFQHYPIAE